MSAPSRYAVADAANTPRAVKLGGSTYSETASGGGSSESQSSFTGIDNPEALKILMATIKELQTGGSADIKAQQANRNQQITSARGTLANYTKGAAFTDAGEVMAKTLRLALEKSMPAISKSIQGAGTSSSSMQGLLSQKLATEASEATSAAQLEAAKAYGQISAQLQQTLEGLTRVDRGNIDALTKALGLLQTQKSMKTATSAPTTPGFSQTVDLGEELQVYKDTPASTKSSMDGKWIGPSMRGGNYVEIGSADSYYDERGNYRG